MDREVDDLGDQALSYAEAKALATGSPLASEKAAVDAELARKRRAGVLFIVDVYGHRAWDRAGAGGRVTLV